MIRVYIIAADTPERLNFALRQIEQSEQTDFSVDESLQIDRENAPDHTEICSVSSVGRSPTTPNICISVPLSLTRLHVRQ